MKRLLIALLCLASFGVAHASQIEKMQEQEVKAEVKAEPKPLTSSWSVLTGTANFANHSISNQEYSGVIFGIEMEFGRMYRRSENVSWELDMNYLRAKKGQMFNGLTNPANTNGISAKVYDIAYATHYNWQLTDKWLLKAGGALNLYGDSNTQTSISMNNAISIQGAMQAYASAGVCYNAEFKKWGMKIYYNMSLPLLGLVFADTRYESAYGSLFDHSLFQRYENHFRPTTLHNFQGVNYEVGIDFITRPLTISVGYEDRDRWWTATKVQNYRKVSLIKIGLGVNLFNGQRNNLSNRYF